MLTSEILQKLAPSTPKAKRDRFLPFLNDALPRYEINTELRIAAFLATVVFESAYLRTTKEYRATKPGKVKNLQDKYWSTGFYGRGLIQTTHERNYAAFDRYVSDRPEVFGEDFFFLDNPSLLEEPRWAVESACFFWKNNNLNKYADKGQFFAIQGITNKGNAAKEALEYPTRLKLYDLALRHLPSDFTISEDAPDQPEIEIAPQRPPTQTETLERIKEKLGINDPVLDPVETDQPKEFIVAGSVNLPQGTGGTEKSKGWSWKLPTLGTIVMLVTSTIQSFVETGYLNAKEVGDKLFVFLTVNYKYAAYVLVAAIFYLIVKKILSYVPTIIEAVTAAAPGLDAVRFKQK